MLGKSFRIELATDITRRVEKLEWDVRALTLSQFGLQDTDGDRFSPSLLEVVGTATDEVLADLGEHFGIIIPDTGDAPASSVTTTVKTAEPLFVFASHISAHKALVGEVKVALAVYGVYLFVAHDSIAVDAAWHEEIEKGLDRADAGVAFIHDGFQTSAWCDQEIGWLLGRHVPVIAFKFDTSPYGPLGKSQAMPASGLTADDIANETIKRLQDRPGLSALLAASLVQAMDDSRNFKSTDIVWLRLRELHNLDSNQCAQLLEATKSNTQIYWAKSAVDGGRSYSRVICDFLRAQPGGATIAADVDSYELYLTKA